MDGPCAGKEKACGGHEAMRTALLMTLDARKSLDEKRAV